MNDNPVKQITTDDLRCMEDQEGLVLQGCGGDPQEWVDGINGLLIEAGILLDGSTFKAEAVFSFQHDGLTCLLFPFEKVKLDMGVSAGGDTDALEETVKQVAAISTSVEKLALNMENMLKEQVSQGKCLETLEGRDGEM